MRVEVKEKPIWAAFVWLSREEGKNEALLQSLKPQYAAWKAQGYLPVVMESGAGNLKDCLYGLMKHYCEKKRQRSRQKTNAHADERMPSASVT